MLDKAWCAVVITAAGAGTRMGMPKALARWRGVPLLLRQLEATDGFGQRIVVLGASADAVRAELELPSDVIVVENADWQTGRSGSLRCGFRAVSEAARGILVAAVDQPVDPEVVERMLEAFDPAVHAWVLPRVGDRRGHPIILSGTLLPTLRELGDDETLRQVALRFEAAALELQVESSLVLVNFNRPEDLTQDGTMLP